MIFNELEKKIIGFKIDKVYLSKCKTYLVFENEKKELIKIHVCADCCSESWVEHINIDCWIDDRKVCFIEQKSMDGLIGSKQEEDRVYSSIFKNELKEQIVALEYRNSSNGYYGGSLEFEEFKFDKNDFDLVKESF